MNYNIRILQYLLRLLYLIMLIVLIGLLIYPHTSINFRTKFFRPFFFRLNAQDVILLPGEVFNLNVIGFNNKISFVTTDFKVCDVSMNGRITARRVGRAIIKVRVDKKILKCKVRVIDISKKSLSIKVGKRYQLKVKGISKSVKWSCSNSRVVTIRKGKLKGKKKGRAVIFANVNGKLMKCNVTVK